MPRVPRVRVPGYLREKKKGRTDGKSQNPKISSITSLRDGDIETLRDMSWNHHQKHNQNHNQKPRAPKAQLVDCIFRIFRYRFQPLQTTCHHHHLKRPLPYSFGNKPISLGAAPPLSTRARRSCPLFVEKMNSSRDDLFEGMVRRSTLVSSFLALRIFLTLCPSLVPHRRKLGRTRPEVPTC